MIMNYDRIYYAIINRALQQESIGQRYKNNGTYYENHHIIPRSLGGSDDINNLVLLTAKEHYICHWLLVKRYEKNTVQRHKMLKAWFMMSAIGDTQRPTVSMRDYAKYRIEFSQIMSQAQSGTHNSQYGKHWYTDLRTGESKRFTGDAPDNMWVLGKNWFKFQKIYSIHSKTAHTISGLKKLMNIQYTNYINNSEATRQLWDKYHSSNCMSINEFYKKRFMRCFMGNNYK